MLPVAKQLSDLLEEGEQFDATYIFIGGNVGRVKKYIHWLQEAEIFTRRVTGQNNKYASLFDTLRQIYTSQRSEEGFYENHNSILKLLRLFMLVPSPETTESATIPVSSEPDRSTVPPVLSVAPPSVDFSRDYQPTPIPRLTDDCWENHLDHVLDRNVLKISLQLLSDPPKEANFDSIDALILSLYLHRSQKSGWRRLKEEPCLSACAERLSLSVDEIPDAIDRTSELLAQLSQTQYLITPEIISALQAYVLHTPSYRFWHALIARAHQLIANSTLELDLRYFVVRDLQAGYRRTDCETLNIAFIVSIQFGFSLHAYLDGKYLSGTENHKLLLKYFHHLLEAIPLTQSTRPKYEKVIGDIAIRMGIISWDSSTPPPENCLEWLKLAWQYTDQQARLAYPLASSLYATKNYSQASQLFEYASQAAPLQKFRHSACLRLTTYYSQIENNFIKAKYWADKAYEIVPDAVSYQILDIMSISLDNADSLN